MLIWGSKTFLIVTVENGCAAFFRIIFLIESSIEQHLLEKNLTDTKLFNISVMSD